MILTSAWKPGRRTAFANGLAHSGPVVAPALALLAARQVLDIAATAPLWAGMRP